MIELRSDTFTLPTPAMRQAMAGAEVGNDDYGEDPTVAALEAMAATRLGKEAACLMPSGTMANPAAILAHGTRGTRVVVGQHSDVYLYEGAGAAVCGGVAYAPIIERPDGTMPLDDVAAALPGPGEPGVTPVGLVCLENTHNWCGGVILSSGYTAQVADLAHAHGVPLHLDGARIFNAEVGSGIPVAQLVEPAESVQFCLSKGLGAPAGSVLAGTAGFVAAARRMRKLLGGSLHQAGVLAAAGIVALSDMVDRLAEDHVNARRLAKQLDSLPGIAVELASVQTNIVIFRVLDERFTPESFVRLAADRGVRLMVYGPGRIRAVTHAGVAGDDIDHAVECLEQVLADGG